MCEFHFVLGVVKGIILLLRKHSKLFSLVHSYRHGEFGGTNKARKGATFRKLRLYFPHWCKAQSKHYEIPDGLKTTKKYYSTGFTTDKFLGAGNNESEDHWLEEKLYHMFITMSAVW